MLFKNTSLAFAVTAAFAAQTCAFTMSRPASMRTSGGIRAPAVAIGKKSFELQSSSETAPMTVEEEEQAEMMAFMKMISSTYEEDLVNPDFWNYFPPFDWDKFYANDPDAKIPKVYDPPQRHGAGANDNGLAWNFSSPNFDDIDKYFVTDETAQPLEEIKKSGRTSVAKISEDLFEKILGPNPDSSKVPEPFRNKLFWMQDNPMSEELCSFNRWAWRSDVEGGRTIGLGTVVYDWTSDISKFGLSMSPAMIRLYVFLQMSPCGKYVKFKMGHPYAPKGMWGSSMTMYVLQEDDVMVDHLGNTLDTKAGDLLRLTYMDGKDPYDCSPANIKFMYRARTVAELEEETGEIKTDFAAYDELMEKVNASPPEGLTSVENLSTQERFALITSTVYDSQSYNSCPTPPTGDEIENL